MINSGDFVVGVMAVEAGSEVVAASGAAATGSAPGSGGGAGIASAAGFAVSGAGAGADCWTVGGGEAGSCLWQPMSAEPATKVKINRVFTIKNYFPSGPIAKLNLSSVRLDRPQLEIRNDCTVVV